MACLAQVDFTFGVEDRLIGVLLHCKSGAREDEVKLYHVFEVVTDLIAVQVCLGTQRREDDLDFFCFFNFQFTDIVVQFDNGHRLDKEGGTGRGLVMYHARNLAFVLGFDRDTAAAVAHRDDGILQIRAVGTVDERD